MFLRLATAIVLMLGLAAFVRQAAAQVIVGPPPGANYPQPGAMPADQNDDDDDVVNVAPPIQVQPLPPPGAMAAPAMPPPGVEPQPTAPPVELTAPARPQPPAATTAAGQPQAQPGPISALFGSILRPPADIDDRTGSVEKSAVAVPPAAAPQATSPGAVASLPPEDQPEVGTPKELPPHLRRQIVEYWTKEPAGTIVIDTPNTYLYLVLGEGKAMRYGIGVGREGFTWAGVEKVTKMAEWPDWYPPAEMIERQPYLPRFMAGGESNPLGARALYLGQTVYRIHGTHQPSTLGSFVSSGCIRLVNADVEDLFTRVKVGTRVVVLPGNPPATAANRAPAGTPPAAAPQAANALPQTR
jgi:lipoprotein-anchoring transpeptidase ErfK/SrfK